MPEDVSALHLVLTGDPALFAIVRLSLTVSLSALLFAALIGVPFGALIALTGFRGREVVIVVLNALMGLPPVVVGLAVFLSLSRSGSLGPWGLLFTPQAMVIAQTILVAPDRQYYFVAGPQRRHIWLQSGRQGFGLLQRLHG